MPATGELGLQRIEKAGRAREITRRCARLDLGAQRLRPHCTHLPATGAEGVRGPLRFGRRSVPDPRPGG